jgi:hypothetical protein
MTNIEARPQTHEATPKTDDDRKLDASNLITTVLKVNSDLKALPYEFADYENDCLLSTLIVAFKAIDKISRAVETYNRTTKHPYECNDYAKHHPEVK